MNPNRGPLLKRSKLNCAIMSAMLASAAMPTVLEAQEQQAENDVIEEVVATGTRLKGSAAAVLQERQNQAFVADILGAEQISRTGDSDAASALRRVTGLTLVDGRFIYVRGLGERYSSTQLNGQLVPSPDPTRSVVPLDLFPASIIESLAVQKSFSPDMPAHFGGGNVNIRTRSIPNQEIFRVQASTGWNFENSDDGFFYGGGSDDWTGRDDGTRALPDLIRNNLEQAQSGAGFEGSSQFPLTLEDRQEYLRQLPLDAGPDPISVDPNLGLGMTYGNVYDLDADSEIGFLATVNYNQSWTVRNEFNGTNIGNNGCDLVSEEDVTDAGLCFAQTTDGPVTERTVTWNGMFNIGYQFNKNHKFELVNVLLHDARDRVRNRDFFDANETDPGVDQFRIFDILFEERRMNSNQLRGEHNFPEYWNSYFDWYVGSARARRQAPGGLEAVFQENIENGEVVSEQLQDVSATNLTMQFQDLRDVTETYGWNAGIPFFGERYELELKAGGSYFEKARDAENVQLEIRHFGIDDDFAFGSRVGDIFSDENVSNPDFFSSATGSNLFQSQTADGDKFVAATQIDAFYLMADWFYDNTWRITGGFRYEDFRQISVPFTANANTFSVNSDELAELAFQEDDIFPSLAITYIFNEQHQLRFNFSETAIRPDLRDISTSFFIDPITDFLVRGSPLLQSSKLENYDVRWEWYMQSGNNLSVALFYKDIENPIELIELPSVGGAIPNLLTANGESGETYGIEAEFLHDLTFVSDKLSNFYMSGNVTISDSEVVIGFGEGFEDSLFTQQLLDALDATAVSPNFVTSNERRLVGHSEWVANLQLGWDADNGEHSATLVYNAFGPRIIVPGVRQFEDAEEETFHSVDFVYTYYPDFNSTVKFSVRNLLDEQRDIRQNGLSVFTEDTGISASLSFQYEF